MLVPRTAFTPAWAAVPVRPGSSAVSAPVSVDEELAGCSREFQEAARLVERLAQDVGAVMKDKGRGRHLCSDGQTPDVSLYLSDQKVWLDMRRLRDEDPRLADAFVAELAGMVGHKVAPIYPALKAASVVAAWPQVEPVIRRYIEVRRQANG